MSTFSTLASIPAAIPDSRSAGVDGRDRPVRVAASPGWHPYLRRLAADDAVDQVSRPGVGVSGGDATSDWVGSLPDDIELVHVLSSGPIGPLGAVSSFVDGVSERGLPLVLTLFDVHDRDLVDTTARNERLDRLVERADVVTTLTRAGADAVARTWGREAIVVGHPHVAPLDLIERVAADPGRGRIAMHRAIGVPISSATGRTSPWEAATALAEVLARRDDVRVDLLPIDRCVATLLADHPLLGDRRVRMLSGERLDEDRLHRWLGELDLVLLPYRHATHSGWIPLCQDLALGVVSVADEAMIEMGLSAGYPARRSGMVDPDEIADALLRGLGTTVRPPDVRRRRTALAAVRAAHRTVYDLATQERVTAERSA